MGASAVAAVPDVKRWRFAALSDFPFEWLGVALLALLDAIWAEHIGFTLAIGVRDFVCLSSIFAVSLAFRTVFHDERASYIAEYLVLTIVTAAVFAVLSYLCWTLPVPLEDARLLRADQTLGFDWLYWFRQLLKHPFLVSAFRLLYASIFLQAVYLLVLFGLSRDRARLREVFWVMLAASSLSVIISAVMPAFGTFYFFRLGDVGGYLHDMQHLRAGRDLHFQFEQLTGVISFPSFHTASAIIYAYAFRNTGIIGIVMAGINLLMLPCIPFLGGHYLIDMIAGVAVAILAIAIVRYLRIGGDSYRCIETTPL